MKILLVGLLIASCFQTRFKYTYTGHSRGWSDNLSHANYDWPVKILWVESIDSTWAEMQIFHDKHQADTITFHRFPIGGWRLTHYTGYPDIEGSVYIDQRNDSLKIGLGFGYTGISFYAKKDSM